MARLKVMALAVATGRIGYVLFKGDELVDWGISLKGSQSRKLAVRQAEKWISLLQPDVVITEDVSKPSRKGARSKRLIAALADYTSGQELSDINVQRAQSFQNKYEEAKALATQFPGLLPWVPKQPRIWESEPRNTVYFEALALALQVVNVRPQ